LIRISLYQYLWRGEMAESPAELSSNTEELVS
jgi:hypothetical protein